VTTFAKASAHVVLDLDRLEDDWLGCELEEMLLLGELLGILIGEAFTVLTTINLHLKGLKSQA